MELSRDYLHPFFFSAMCLFSHVSVITETSQHDLPPTRVRYHDDLSLDGLCVCRSTRPLASIRTSSGAVPDSNSCPTGSDSGEQRGLGMQVGHRIGRALVGTLPFHSWRFPHIRIGFLI